MDLTDELRIERVRLKSFKVSYAFSHHSFNRRFNISYIVGNHKAS